MKEDHEGLRWKCSVLQPSVTLSWHITMLTLFRK